MAGSSSRKACSLSVLGPEGLRGSAPLRLLPSFGVKRRTFSHGRPLLLTVLLPGLADCQVLGSQPSLVAAFNLQKTCTRVESYTPSPAEGTVRGHALCPGDMPEDGGDIRRPEHQDAWLRKARFSQLPGWPSPLLTPCHLLSGGLPNTRRLALPSQVYTGKVYCPKTRYYTRKPPTSSQTHLVLAF